LEGEVVSRTAVAFLFILLASFLIVGIHTVESASKTIVVPDDYPTIQDAIDNATSGDTVFVRSGTYFEHVGITKAVSLMGENKYDTIIDGGGQDVVIGIGADFVSLTGFTVQGSDPDGGYGVALADSTNVTVKNLNTQGISLSYCANCTVENCVSYASSVGILLSGSSGITVRNSTIANCSDYGIAISWVNPDVGIFGNFISGNRVGIFVTEGHESPIVVSGNVISENERGVYLRFEWNCVVRENLISNNSRSGIFDQYDFSSENRIFHNSIINNPVEFDYPPVFDDGYPSGGNYWGDYFGNDTYSGPYQNITGSDGIGDTPYRALSVWIPCTSIDRYPLMKPYVPPIGDVNGDWKVNMADVGVAARAFGSTIGDERWNQQADMNPDGKIDLRDIALEARNFGKIYR
jgi:parallel beta-helix repeat protein